MVSLELTDQSNAFSGGSNRGIKQQTILELDRRHADRYSHEKDTLQLLKTPDLARYQLAPEGAPLPEGIQRQQRPPGPVLICRLSSAYRHAVCQWCLNSAEPQVAADSGHGHLPW